MAHAYLAAIGRLSMLTRKLNLTLDGLEVGATPMLVPAVSSRANIPLTELLEVISEIVDGPLLVSAYDYYYSDEISISFPDLIFLDSGGYECNKDQDVSDIGLYNPNPFDWNENLHAEVVDAWSSEIPTVMVSYDHPSVRDPIETQVEKARDLLRGKSNTLKEILIKPETMDSVRVNRDSLVENINLLESFDIVGFTEKELGHSVLQRMISIASIRKAMDEQNIIIPIHIFGSLDTVVTPLYYFSGADIFDGLSWLRFLFHNGSTQYIDSYGPKNFGLDENMRKIWIQTVYQNHSYLRRLQLDMEKFQSTEDFGIFGSNADFFRTSCDDLDEKMRSDGDGR